MKKGLIYLFSIVLILQISSVAFSQTHDNQIALKYFQNNEFDKASDLYLKLYNKSNSQYFLNFYLKSLVELKDFESAEKFLKKEIKRNPEQVSLHVKYGSILKIQNKIDKSNQQFELAIKNLSNSSQEIVSLSNEFISNREYQYAENTLRKGQKVNKEYLFNTDLAHLFYVQRNYSAMINEYLNLIEIEPEQLETVQNKLNNSIYRSSDESMIGVLKKNLLKRVQKSPDITVFSNLLIWIYIQDKDFENAYTYSVAIDKRNKENGDKLISLGKIAMSNSLYDIAIKSYNYVINKGDKFINYYEAKTLYLSSLYKKIKNSVNYTQAEVLALESNYLTTISELYPSNEKYTLIREVAHLEGFYLHKPEIAIEKLEKLIENTRLNQTILNECKLELGDLYLLKNDVWTATIYYAQVEKNNANATISHEAKFRKAKLAYYVGDFQWAEAQLDVLKASTTKLIANDAFYLATIISDNTILDTTEVPLQMYARADLLLFQNKDSIALLTLDSILTRFKYHSLSDEVLFLKAKIATNYKDYNLAAENYKKIIDNYSYDILADDALFKLAIITEEQFKDIETAKKLYNKLLVQYTNSIYTVESRRRFRNLRGDFKTKSKRSSLLDL